MIILVHEFKFIGSEGNTTFGQPRHCMLDDAVSTRLSTNNADTNTAQSPLPKPHAQAADEHNPATLVRLTCHGLVHAFVWCRPAFPLNADASVHVRSARTSPQLRSATHCWFALSLRVVCPWSAFGLCVVCVVSFNGPPTRADGCPYAIILAGIS